MEGLVEGEGDLPLGESRLEAVNTHYKFQKIMILFKQYFTFTDHP